MDREARPVCICCLPLGDMKTCHRTALEMDRWDVVVFHFIGRAACCGQGVQVRSFVFPYKVPRF